VEVVTEEAVVVMQPTEEEPFLPLVVDVSGMSDEAKLEHAHTFFSTDDAAPIAHGIPWSGRSG
jgi:hypothetical protein